MTTEKMQLIVLKKQAPNFHPMATYLNYLSRSNQKRLIV